MPDAAAEGRRLGRAVALDRLVGRYLPAAVYSTPAGLARLFAVPRSEVVAAVGRLERAGRLTAGVEIAGRPGRFIVSA